MKIGVITSVVKQVLRKLGVIDENDEPAGGVEWPLTVPGGLSTSNNGAIIGPSDDQLSIVSAAAARGEP